MRITQYGFAVQTTIELPDDLAAKARHCAADSGTTVRSVIEEALRRELARRQRPVEWKSDHNLAFESPTHLQTLRSLVNAGWPAVRFTTRGSLPCVLITE